MKMRTIRGWTADALCGKETVPIYFVLPDVFFEVDLFSCKTCRTLFGVDRERERYSEKAWIDIQTTQACPQCGNSLQNAVKYPETFTCPDGSEGHFLPPAKYPPDSELVDINVWDPFD
jgi:hypothetical protein